VSRRETEYIERQRRDAAEARTLFSNVQKPKRERMVVRAFLRCIGEQFSDDEIRAGADEPVDVAFRTARFQIREILGGRQRGREWREREQRYEHAERISDLLEPWDSSEPLALDEASKAVADGLAEKAARYGVENCSKLEALVYIDLKGRHLWPLPSQPFSLDEESAVALDHQSWRSVSMLLLPYGVVLAAQPSAPGFLRSRKSLILNQWPDIDGWCEP